MSGKPSKTPPTNNFAQADSLVPAGVQGYDRYAYVNNNPINYVDPSGHKACTDDGYCGNLNNYNGGLPYTYTPPLLEFTNDPGQSFSEEEMRSLQAGAQDVANALARGMNSSCAEQVNRRDDCGQITAQEAFYDVFGGSITVRRSGSDCDCWAEHRGRNAQGSYEIWIYSTTSSQEILSHPLLIVHEIGHAFAAATGINAGSVITNDLLRPINSDGIIDYADNQYYGYAGPHFKWQFGTDSNNRQGEELADMFVGWVYNTWENSTLGNDRRGFMNTLMVNYLP